jgi:hypothetical protein
MTLQTLKLCFVIFEYSMQVAVNLTSLSRITEVEAVCAGRVALHYPEVYLLCKSEYEKEEEERKRKKNYYQRVRRNKTKKK